MSSEIMFERIQENLQLLKMKNTLEILPNYLERAVKDDLNIIGLRTGRRCAGRCSVPRTSSQNSRLAPRALAVLDHIFTEEARGKQQRAYENQVRMSAIPMKKTIER